MSNQNARPDIVQQLIDAFNAHDADAWSELYSEMTMVYDPQYKQPLKGREAVRKDMADFFLAFPDIQATVVNVVRNDELLATESELRGTHDGPLIVPSGTIPATHQQMNIRLGEFVRLDAQGRISESSRYYDLAGMMEQLGLLQAG